MRSVRRLAATSVAAAKHAAGWLPRGRRQGRAVSTRDSAGISIVENTGPAWPADRGWKVVDSPLVDIGDVDHVLGPVRLSDGRLAIANAGTNEVRIYDARGAHLKSSGRAGSGPGEYRNLVGIWAGPADSLMVSDILVRRLTVLDREGVFARSLSLGGTAGGFTSINGSVDFAVPLGWLADGSIIGLSQTFTMNATREGIFRDTITMIRYGPDGAVRDTVGHFPGPEMEQMTITMGAQSMAAPSPVPLGKQFVGAARGDRIYVGLNNAWEIEMRGVDGSLKRLIRSAERQAGGDHLGRCRGESQGNARADGVAADDAKRAGADQEAAHRPGRPGQVSRDLRLLCRVARRWRWESLGPGGVLRCRQDSAVRRDRLDGTISRAGDDAGQFPGLVHRAGRGLRRLEGRR